MLHRCLSPDPTSRPTAAELRDSLIGRGAKAEPSKKPTTPTAAPAAPPARPSPPKGEPLVSDGMELVDSTGRKLQIGVRTELGKAVMRQFGADGEFWDDRQCVIERGAGRQWIISPVAGTVNETLVNGHTLVAPHALAQGDVIAVGRQQKGVLKLPLTARRP